MQILDPNSYTDSILIERGRNSFVYRARRARDGEPVAVKAKDLSFITRARWLDILQIYKPCFSFKHPRLVALYTMDLDEEREKFLLEMELCSGGTLHDLVVRRRHANRPLRDAEIWYILAQILEGMTYLYQKSPDTVAYQGLGSRTVLFTETGQVKLCSFGKSQNFVGPMSAIDLCSMGSIAPEIRNGDKPSAASDVWALGCIALELCTLAPPDLPITSDQHPLNLVLENRCPELKAFIELCLMYDANKRRTILELQSAEVIKTALLNPTDVDMLFSRPNDEGEDSRRPSSPNGFLYHTCRSLSSLQHDFSRTVEKDMYSARLLVEPSEGTTPRGSFQQPLTMSMVDNMFDDTRQDIERSEIHQVRRSASAMSVNHEVTSLYARMDKTSASLQLAIDRQWNNLLPPMCEYIAENNLDVHLRRRTGTIVDTPTNLMEAIRACDNEQVPQFLSELGCIYRGQTSLMLAASMCRPSLISTLLQELGIVNEQGKTALTYAIEAGDPDSIRLLLPEADMCGYTKLMIFAASGNLVRVQDTLKEARSRTTGKGMTALMLAAQHGHTDIVKVLAPMEGRQTCDDGTTALMLATAENHISCAQALLVYEAGMQRNDGWTALTLAAFLGLTGIVELLLEKESGAREKNAGNTALILAVQHGRIGAATALVHSEARSTNHINQTALMFAAREGQKDCVSLLSGHEGRLCDRDGNTALMYASKMGHTECVQLLATREISITNKEGMTALMYACQNGHVACAQLLLHEAGFATKANYWRGAGYTALMFAAERGHMDCVKLLHPLEGTLVTADGRVAVDLLRLQMRKTPTKDRDAYKQCLQALTAPSN
ncbi:Kinase, NEK [Giardia muris]|uniref:Kinase, NEK n=1 Tax=Giardia muris TaxID=5742 RepID=A0A4Z1TCQ7_GIAMU|nr:Kinase, NEK [Giardia muris]|eukprot:TNJ30281.1 Kinase, NEK [Giardia muris]